MTEPIRRTPTGVSEVIGSADTFMWKRESNRQREITLRLAKEYRVIAKARRAEDHNEGLSLKERRTFPETKRSDHTQEASQQDEEKDVPFETRFDEGDQALVFMEKVKPGLKKQLDHR